MLDIKSREDEVLKYWTDNGIDDKVRKKNSGGKKFYFLDGPPYVTGELAAHHIWVETIKDIVLRYRRYKGLNVHDRAGFDVHGLPIEVKVEKMLGITSKRDIEKRIGVDQFVTSCREYASGQAKGAIASYIRFGSSLDFKNVYMPYENYYISSGWFIFKELYNKKLIYKGLAPLAYCPRCETVLSAQGPEVEYEDTSDSSIYIRFKVDNQKSRGARIKLGTNTYLVVWTTTPWTLPSNMAIAVNPKELYVIAGTGHEHYIIAKERLDALASAANLNLVIGSEFYGSELEGIYFISPLEREVPMQKTFAKHHRVILSESFVNVNEGTGLLHVAPGHGPEDFKLGRENKMPAFSPIDTHADYTEEAGVFRGLKVPGEANRAVLEKLKENHAILFESTLKHSYPHCWRCHSKLIYRATEQWFVNVQKIKKKMLTENSKIVWHPAAATDWFADAVANSPDWCLSRQRYWGAPIPIWTCEKCESIGVIGSSKELKERAGLESELPDLHRPYVDKIAFKCKGCEGSMQRIPDIFDVWYDAGISHTASLREGEFKRLFPADWITESRDQIRGWFSVLLRTSVAVYGKTPFKRVNIGGMIKDELGQQMHRHLGNTVSVAELLEIVTADGFRLWCASHPRWLELKLKRGELTEADSNIMTLYNVANLVKEFALLSSNDIRRLRKPSLAKLHTEERWILSRLNTLIDETTSNLENYYVDVAVKNIRDFILDDFSRFYLKFAKQRAETAGKPELRRISSITAYVLNRVLVLASVVVPFAAESIHRELFSEKDESIFMGAWPKHDKKFIDKSLEDDFGVLKESANAILYLRENRNAKLRWPIKEAIIETSSDSIIASLERVSNQLAMYTNSKSIRILKGNASLREVRPVFQALGPAFKENAQTVADELKTQDADAVEKSINASGYYRLHTSRGTFDIKAGQFNITEKKSAEKGESIRYNNTDIYFDIDTKLTEGIKEELVAREFIRRVQVMRKELSLTRMDSIALYISADEPTKLLVQKGKGQIKRIVKAKSISINGKIPEGVQMKSFDILGANVEIGIGKTRKN